MVERVIRRAAELQAAEHDLGEGLTEDEILAVGKEVGIPPLLLRQALLEETARTAESAEQGFTSWLMGPRRLFAERVIPDGAGSVQRQLDHWMTSSELLTVKRRYPNLTSWEARKDFFSSVKRELGVGGRTYALARAREVSAAVIGLEDRTHVRLTADLVNTRRSHVQGGVALLVAGAAATLVGVTLGVALPIALIPGVVGALSGFGVLRRRRQGLERVQVGMEQVLDRLERREIGAAEQGKSPGPLGRLAVEIKRQLEI